MKFRLFISALITALLVIGPVVHASTHEIVPDSAHEFVECFGCSVALATVEETGKQCHHQTHETYRNLPTNVVLVTRFDNYSPRAPPEK